MIDLEPSSIEEIKRILRKHAAGFQVWAFGSRIQGNAQRFSDLDLALIGPGKMDWRRMEELKDAFSESDLPIQVDVLDWHTLSELFQKIIQANHEEFPV